MKSKLLPSVIQPFLAFKQLYFRCFSTVDAHLNCLHYGHTKRSSLFQALRQFVIQPTLQPAWQVACDQAEAAREAEPEPAGRLGLFPWATEATFRQLFGVPLHLQQKEKGILPLFHHGCEFPIDYLGDTTADNFRLSAHVLCRILTHTIGYCTFPAFNKIIKNYLIYIVVNLFTLMISHLCLSCLID